MGSFTLYYIWSGQPEQFLIPQHVSKHEHRYRGIYRYNKFNHCKANALFLVAVCIGVCCIHHFCLLLLFDHLVEQVPSLQYHDCLLAYAGDLHGLLYWYM